MGSAYTRREIVADAVVHIIGTVAGIAGGLVLLATANGGGPVLTFSVAAYTLALIAMLSFSALYNLALGSPRRALYRRLDRTAIFIMIAGSYTPFALVKIGGALGLGLFVTVWLGAAFDSYIELWHPRRWERQTFVLYLALGWCIVLAAGPLLDVLAAPALALLLGGGLIYTAGAMIYLWQRLPYHNAIWHALVLVAAGCHYAAIYRYVALPAVA